jgi:predicted nucleic acid-binding protein
MVTAIDSSVLIDVLLDDPEFCANSKAALRQASAEGSLILCEVVLAEVTPVIGAANLEEFLHDWNLTFSPSSAKSAVLAGDMFNAYLQRGGKRGRVVPDFLIAAHAQLHANRLLARDCGFYRDYFKKLRLWDPSSSK